MTNTKKKPYFFFKRAFDVLASFFAIIILSPFIFVISLIALCMNGWPIFYSHVRVGKNKKPFHIIKFRSMKNDNRPISEQLNKEQYEEYLKTYKVTNDPRLTKFGKFIRKTSIDELPQLINIFKGDMSFIGPRPVLEKELEKFNDKQELITSLRPGLTGYWACKGRSEITDYDKRVELEAYYVENVSFKLDCYIFFKTIAVVFSKKGAI